MDRLDITIKVLPLQQSEPFTESVKPKHMAFGREDLFESNRKQLNHSQKYIDNSREIRDNIVMFDLACLNYRSISLKQLLNIGIKEKKPGFRSFVVADRDGINEES